MATPSRMNVPKGTCATCGGPAITFKNESSEKEYTVSGMCQQCQDKLNGFSEAMNKLSNMLSMANF
jgi:hypothetical protein